MSFKILVPLDGTPQADRALLYSEMLVRNVGGQLKLIRSGASGTPTDYIERALDRIAARLRETGVSAEWSLAEGDIFSGILGAARSWQADMIAVATNKWSGMDRWLNNGIADAVLRSAQVPTLVVPPEWERTSSGKLPSRILVPLDGSPLAERALRPATELAGRLHAELVLLRVVEQTGTEDASESYLRGLREHMGSALSGDRVRARVLSGSPADEIARAVQALDVDLIVMSTHGRSGLERVVLGSTTAKTLEQSTIPLVVIGPKATESMANAAPASADPLTGITPVAESGAHDLDCVDEQSQQSFPASDAPSWSGSTI